MSGLSDDAAHALRLFGKPGGFPRGEVGVEPRYLFEELWFVVERSDIDVTTLSTHVVVPVVLDDVPELPVVGRIDSRHKDIVAGARRLRRPEAVPSSGWSLAVLAWGAAGSHGQAPPTRRAGPRSRRVRPAGCGQDRSWARER